MKKVPRTTPTSLRQDEERALRFRVDTVEYPRQEMVANKIRMRTQMMLWVHKFVEEMKQINSFLG